MGQKVKVTESQLRQIIRQRVMKEMKLTSTKNIRTESVDRNEYLYKKVFENVKRVLMEDDDRYGEKKANSKKRNEVMAWLKDPKTNLSEVGRELWGVEQGSDEDDAKRSLMSKKVNHAPNDDGYPYDFTEDEITTLYRIMQR